MWGSAGGVVGQRLDGAGLAAAVAVVAAAVADRSVGPGEVVEPVVHGRLVHLHRDHQVRAAGGDLAGVAGLGVQRVSDDDHAVQAAELGLDSVQRRGERRDLVDFAAICTWARTTPVLVS